MAITECLAKCKTFTAENTEVKVRGLIENKYARMKQIVQNAYDLTTAASEQIDWMGPEYALFLERHRNYITEDLALEKTRAEAKLDRTLADLKDFCPDPDTLVIDEQMEIEVYEEFEFNARFFVTAMMKDRYNPFRFGIVAGPYSAKPNPTKFTNVAPSNWHASVAMYNFDQYCTSAKYGFDVYLKEVNENVQTASREVISFVDKSGLPPAAKTMLKAAVQFQIKEFDRKVEQSEMCYNPAVQEIRTQENIIRVVKARIDATEAELRQIYCLVLIRELKNVG